MITRIYEGYFNDKQSDNDEIVKDVESNSLNIQESPDSYSAELMFEFSFTGSSVSSSKRDEHLKDILKIQKRIKYCLDNSIYVDKMSEYMPVHMPSHKNYKECTTVEKDETTGLELRSHDLYDRGFIFTNASHYGITVFCDLELNNVRDVVKFIRYCFSIAQVTGVRDYKRPYILSVQFNKVNGKKLLKHYNLRLNNDTAPLFLDKYKQSRQANWNQNNKGYSKNFLKFICSLFGTGHTQDVLDYLDVSQNQIVVDEMLHGQYFNVRKKRLGTYELCADKFDVDKFIEYVWPLCKDEVYMFDAVEYDFRWNWHCTVDKNHIRDYIVNNNATISAYWYRMSKHQIDVIIYVIDELVEDADTDIRYVLFASIGKDLTLLSDYDTVNISDFVTPLAVMGVKPEKIMKNYPLSEYFTGQARYDECKDLIYNNIK